MTSAPTARDAGPAAEGTSSDVPPGPIADRPSWAWWRMVVASRRAAYIVTLTAGLWVTRSFWWPGRYVVAFDGYAYSGPNLAVTEAATRAGRLALWNDSIFGGVTHLGNPQAGALYPLRLISLVLEDNRALGVLAASHVVLLGCGMVALSFRLSLRPWAAGFVGLATVLNGMVLTKSVQLEQILVLGWTPWLLTVIVTTLTTTRSIRPIAALSVVTAVILLAGHPQMVFETIVLAGALTIGVASSDGRWRRLPRVALGVTLGAFIAAPQLVATAVATNQSAIRGGRDPALLLDPRLSLLPGAAARALLGTLSAQPQDAFVGSFESVAFIGVALAVLAVFGGVVAVSRADLRPWGIPLAVCAVLALAWSVGPRTAPFRLASDLLPGFDLARVSARWLVVVVLVVCLFAGVGLEAVVDGVGRRQLAIATSAVALGGAVILVRHLDGPDRGVAIEWVAVGVLTLATLMFASNSDRRRRAGAGVLLGVATVSMLGLMSLRSVPQQTAAATPFTSSSYRTATTEWLQGREGYVVSFTDDGLGASYAVPGLRPNSHVLVGARSIDGYDGGVQITDRWAAALRRLTADPSVDLPLRNSVVVPLDAIQLGRLGVHYVLIDRTRPIAEMVPGWIGPQVTDDRFEVWENPAWVGEAIAWSSTDHVDAADAPDVLRERADQLSETALVSGPDEALTCDDATVDCAPVALPVDRRSPEDVIVLADLDRPTLVTLDQQYEEGWRVTVDGTPAEVEEVDGLIIGVRVPPGPHEVRWKYIPGWLWPTLVVSLVAIVLTIVLALPRGVTPRGQRPPR